MTDEDKVTVEVEVGGLPEGYIILDHIVLLKVLNPDGKVVFREHFGNSLNPMERYGMTRSATDTCETMINGTMRRD